MGLAVRDILDRIHVRSQATDTSTEAKADVAHSLTCLALSISTAAKVVLRPRRYAPSLTITNDDGLASAREVVLRPAHKIAGFEVVDRKGLSGDVEIDFAAEQVAFDFGHDPWTTTVYLDGHYFEVSLRQGKPDHPICEFDNHRRCIYVNWGHPVKPHMDDATFLKSAILLRLAHYAAPKDANTMMTLALNMIAFARSSRGAPNRHPFGYLKKHLTRRSRVLLINPPVQERRYHWIRWNQPSTLRLSAWLKATHRGIDVKLFDFMMPDEGGHVPKHKVKETWTGSSSDDQLWHFGQPFEAFERSIATLTHRGSAPDVVNVTSLTSYWHESIEKLLHKLCTKLEPKRRDATLICLAGNYPRLEPAHAETQLDADVAFTTSVDTSGYCPDLDLYRDAAPTLPAVLRTRYRGTDIEEHLGYCLA